MAGALVPVLLAAACGPGASTLRILNRTQVPVVVAFGDSSLVIGACTERTVELSGAGVWGGVHSDGGLPHVEAPPPGAYVLALPALAEQPGGEAHWDLQLLVAQGYVGFRHVGSWDEGPKAGTGTFPPDPAAVDCAGSPPPQPLQSTAPSATQRGAGG
jgi:hypothetical protein